MFENFPFFYAGKSQHEIEAILFHNIEAALYEKYGRKADKAIVERVHQEWNAIETNNNVLDVAILHELCNWMRQAGYAYWLNGNTGSSFILYLLGVAAVNPLPAHYLCPKCHAVRWGKYYKSGFDLPPDFCSCGNGRNLMQVDGHDIPWQMLWEYDGKPKELHIKIDPILQEHLCRFFENHWLKRIDSSIVPIVSLSENKTFFRFSNITFDLMSKETSGVHNFFANSVDVSYTATALKNWKYLVHGTADELENITPPETFADLIYLYGLFVSTGTWDEECEFMMERLCYPPSEMIAFVDDVFQYMLDHGFIKKDALQAAQRVKNGENLPFFRTEMVASRDRWVLPRLETIQYLFPKAHAIEHILFMLKTRYSSFH